ncbi:MAG TPA: hypothetical protein VFA27_01735 [Vicinamibacterales bacterium]|nr:hypothetical protein [Vicinamibacterales bacterium]
MNGLPAGVTIGDNATPWTARRIVTPLGIRFRDIALDTPVTHGLVTFVMPRSNDAAPQQLSANPSGVFGFHNVPLLHHVEYPRSLDDDVWSPPAARPFVVMVADRLSRFLPVVFGIEPPLPPMGSPPLVDLDPDPAPVLDAYLFTSPTRAITPGLAGVRFDLWDREAEEPAAHARVRVTIGDRMRIGIADERGRVLVLVPWPLIERLRLGSPPGSGQTNEQTWTVSIDVWYEPDLPRPFGDAAVLSEPWRTLPGLKSVLEESDRAAIWPSPAGPPVPTWSGAIAYDRELVVRTDTVSELWISRGASPP